MSKQHEIGEAIMDACHGFTFDEIGGESVETSPVVTQNGETHFDLDVEPFGRFTIIIKPINE